MRLSDKSYEEEKREVVCLLTNYNVTSFDALGAPLAEKMGISLIPYSTLDPERYGIAYQVSEDGFYMEHAGCECIYCNDQKPRERMKWTIMHELAHCVLGHTADMDEAEREAEADFFAKYALAPPPLVHQYKVEAGYDISGLCGLSYEASCNAYEYYRSWLMYGNPEYQQYELSLLRLFGFSSIPGQENSIRPKKDAARRDDR